MRRSDIPEDLVSLIKERSDIAKVISSCVTLTRAGQHLKGLCPFHTEKTPSFFVNPTRQRFHCFGCGIDGDVIAFLMKTRGVTFHDAVHDLSRQIGFDMPLAQAHGKRRKSVLPKPRPRPPDWRCQASRLEDHTLTLWLRAERVLTAASGLDIGAWDDAELNASLAAVAKAYVDLGRADLLTDIAFHLRCRGLEEEAKRRTHAA